MKPKRILLGVVVGSMVFVAGVFLLEQNLGNCKPVMFRGQSMEYWLAQVYSTDVNASNQANALLNAEIIPQFTNQMFHDRNDFWLRVKLVDAFNDSHLFEGGILFAAADERRGQAAVNLGDFGPAAKSAIPALVQALQSNDKAVHEGALKALGAIHGQPEVVIPLLMKYLDDDDLNDEAATALGNFGSLAQAAVPRIIPLLHAPDDDAQVAAAKALQKIDPAAYAKATNAPAK